MFGRLKQMLIKELIQVLRDKRTRLILIVPPIIQMLVFGYAANFDIRNVSTAIVDLDNSQQSRELVSRFTSSPYFNVQHQLSDAREAHNLIENGDTTLALEIDAGFAQKLEKGQTAPVQVIVDATNSNTALIASAYVSQVALGFAQQMQHDRIYRIAPQLIEQLPSVQLQQRPWYNPDLSSRWFFVPGVIGSLTTLLVITLTSFAVVREREIGTLEQIMVTPIRPVEFILGKTLPFFLIGLFDALLIGIVGTFWFQIPFRGHVFRASDRSRAFPRLHARYCTAHLHRFLHATAGHGDVILRHHAHHHILWLWISNQRNATVDAGPQLCNPTALFSDCSARYLP